MISKPIMMIALQNMIPTPLIVKPTAPTTYLKTLVIWFRPAIDHQYTLPQFGNYRITFTNNNDQECSNSIRKRAMAEADMRAAHAMDVEV
jgi:hypothetical protein